jgi:hypothetical protein
MFTSGNQDANITDKHHNNPLLHDIIRVNKCAKFSQSSLSQSVELPEEVGDEEEAGALLQVYHLGKAASRTSVSSLKMEGQDFFHQKVDKDLQPVLPGLKGCGAIGLSWHTSFQLSGMQERH